MKIPTPNIDKKENAKYYLDYIDKEMTFAGVVTTFNIGGIVFLINKFGLTKENLGDPYYLTSIFYLILASCLLLTHRSRLAFYYGQISLEIYTDGFTIAKNYTNKPPLDYLFKTLDNWQFWYKYFTAIMCMAGAVVTFVLFMCINESNLHNAFTNECKKHPEYIIPFIVVAAGLAHLTYMYYLNKYYPNNNFKRINDISST